MSVSGPEERLHVVRHPLVAHRMAELRSVDTKPDRFRALAAELASMLAYEAARTLATAATELITPMGVADGDRLAGPHPLVVPVLRAGLSMLDATLSVIPTAEVALLGLRRDEQTLVPSLYCDTVPPDLGGRDVFVLDPMLATGGSLSFACAHMRARGAGRLRVVCLVAAPEGVRRIAADDDETEVWTAALDRGLNDDGYIVPGLGDAGDRLYGVLAP
jgi:uracil phosphoribosyltransferase